MIVFVGDRHAHDTVVGGQAYGPVVGAVIMAVLVVVQHQAQGPKVLKSARLPTKADAIVTCHPRTDAVGAAIDPLALAGAPPTVTCRH